MKCSQTSANWRQIHTELTSVSCAGLWEQTSAAGTGLVTSDLRAPQLRLPFLAASEAQAGIS